MFFGHCHRTRFRDSFCLASVFEMTVYLLTYTYLLDIVHAGFSNVGLRFITNVGR